MLIEHNVKYAIVGHSEPRKYFSETDEQINKRAVFAQSSGLTPIVCVGETLEQRERGEADRVITCLLYTSPSPRDATLSRMPSSA